ncbi:hypothetical protein LTR67_008530 [Exophiala xenobiotica]
MAPPTLILPGEKHSQVSNALLLEPLTPSSFSPFGTAITPPFSSSLNNVPTSIPRPLHSPHQPTAAFANQNSALRTSPISQFTNNYPSRPGYPVSTPQMSMFSCFPRNISGVGIDSPIPGKVAFKVSILERHPYTTQTFTPLGVSPSAEDQSTVFLVIVAPSLASPATARTASGIKTFQIANPPDLSRIKAFVARGDQAVTYGPGTWHAPMAVFGQRRVDFVVSQFANGVPDDDCQEVLLGDNAVTVDLDTLNLDLGPHGSRPKL